MAAQLILNYLALFERALHPHAPVLRARLAEYYFTYPQLARRLKKLVFCAGRLG
ncbi:hypothetical protein WM42_0196 [Corynebacterium simulans]|nr:hypothetical protein WM42_0196 [Corynebacterium simulans]